MARPLASRIAASTIRRRQLLRLAASLPLAGCGSSQAWHARDITHSMPALAFRMTDATTDHPATAADFRGEILMLCFGYTFCPDVCPTTLSNLAIVLQRLGNRQDQARVLFVTVDPERDTVAVLQRYTALFGPDFVGLRGTADQLAALARRYRVGYSVTPGANGAPPEVSHSALVFVFDRTGAARLLVTAMATPTPDIAGVTQDIRRLIDDRRSELS